MVLLHLAIISAASRPSYRRYASRTLAETRWSPNVECGNTHCSEQVHLALGGPGEMIVIFVTQDDTTPSEVRWRDLDVDEPQQRLATGSSQTYSQLQWIDPMLIDPAMGAATSTADQVVQLQDPAHKDNVIFGLGMYNNPNLIYNAPLVHQVSLSPCLGGASYEYVVAGDNRVHRFTMPPDAGAAQYPYTFGMTADLGQTAASEANVALLRRTLANADAEGSTATVVLLAGDLAYADGWFSRWDSFGRMMEPLAAEYAVMTTGGNHEIGTGEAWLSYNVRYPMPHQSSGSKSNLWWSRDVGPVHLVALCSYAATHPGSLQYRWLERDLAALDRQRTPWLIVQMHVPWYHSNSLHRDEAVAMRRNMELLLYKAGVDLIIAGHVHAYERTVPVLDGHPNACGPVHLTLGDGGNREGAALPWLEPAPSWSAFRAGSFGVGALRIHNETHALFNWTRTSCEDASAPEHINMDPTCVRHPQLPRSQWISKTK